LEKAPRRSLCPAQTEDANGATSDNGERLSQREKDNPKVTRKYQSYIRTKKKKTKRGWPQRNAPEHCTNKNF